MQACLLTPMPEILLSCFTAVMLASNHEGATSGNHVYLKTSLPDGQQAYMLSGLPTIRPACRTYCLPADRKVV
jgi:hypothetical protein